VVAGLIWVMNVETLSHDTVAVGVVDDIGTVASAEDVDQELVATEIAFTGADNVVIQLLDGDNGSTLDDAGEANAELLDGTGSTGLKISS
jgi:hypothetical protein